jgi:hypothetical protein
MPADALELGLAALLCIGRCPVSGGASRHRPSETRYGIVDAYPVVSHCRLHRPVCGSGIDMHLEGSAVGTLRPGTGEARCMHLVRTLQTHHVRGAFPFAGGSGSACRSYAPVFSPAAGRRRRTWSLRARAPIHTARMRKSVSARPVVGSDALRLLLSVMFPRCVPCSRAWRWLYRSAFVARASAAPWRAAWIVTASSR